MLCFSPHDACTAVFRQAKVYRVLAVPGIRFADLTLKPRLAEHPARQTDRQTVSFFFLHVAIRNSLRSNKLRIDWGYIGRYC